MKFKSNAKYGKLAESGTIFDGKVGVLNESDEIRRCAMKNNLAYICSPYRGNIYQRIRNIVYARRITRVASELGYTPIATHLYLPQVLNDNTPAQRRRGLRYGKDILNACGTIIIGARYGISEGMAAEIEAAAGKDTIIII